MKFGKAEGKYPFELSDQLNLIKLRFQYYKYTILFLKIITVNYKI